MNITRLTQSLLHRTGLTSLVTRLLIVPMLALGLSQSAMAGRVDHAKVLSVQPLYAFNRHHQQECWPENSRYDSHRGNVSIINGVIGGTGYSLQINPGTNRNHYDSNRNHYNHHNNHYSDNRHGYQQPRHYNRGQRDCAPRHGTHHRQKLVGYDVIYKYHGRTYRTRTPYHPGRHLRVSERGLPI